MKKRILTAGIAVLALVFVTGLTGCASVDQQTLKKEGVPQDQRASLYLVMYETRLEKIDDVKQGRFVSLYGLLGGWHGTLDKTPGYGQEVRLELTAQVSAGEHTIIVSDKALIGRKSYTGTFNFEAGKKYVVRLVTPSEYEAMMMPGFEGMKELGNVLKESLAGNQIVIIAESNKAAPTYYDRAIGNDRWVKSSDSEAAGSGEAADSGEAAGSSE
jgi:hypothetical protein